MIEHEVDFLVRPVLDEPDNAKYILELLQKVGVNRFSLSRKQPQWRRVVNMLDNWGFDVHVDHIMSFETFLQAALLSPRSMTINPPRLEILQLYRRRRISGGPAAETYCVELAQV